MRYENGTIKEKDCRKEVKWTVEGEFGTYEEEAPSKDTNNIINGVIFESVREKLVVRVGLE